MGISAYDGDDVFIKLNDSTTDGYKVPSGQQTMANSVPVVLPSNQTVAVSAAVLPLPSGASTSANQTTEIASLSSIDSKLTTTNSTLATIHGGIPAALGQTTMAASMPVTISSNQSSISVLTPDVAPLVQTITALDSGVTPFTGANGQVFYAGTPTVSSAASFSLSGIETVSVQATLLGTGGTMVVEVSYDSGLFWFRPNVYQVSTQTYGTSFTAPFQAIVNVAGATNIRVRSTVSWSGTATINLKETTNSRMVTIADALPSGSNQIGAVTVASSALPTGASTSANQATEIASLASIDSKMTTNNASLATIDAGIPESLGQTTMTASMPVVIASNQTALPVYASDSNKATYSASAVINPANSATDVFTLLGSASKVIRVLSITVNGQNTLGTTINSSIIKRSAADTSGTSSVITGVSHDSTNASATAVCRAYTANPTLGSAVGTVATSKMNFAASGALGDYWETLYGNRPGQSIVLRGTSEQICVNLGANTVSSVACRIEWTEQ